MMQDAQRASGYSTSPDSTRECGALGRRRGDGGRSREKGRGGGGRREKDPRVSGAGT